MKKALLFISIFTVFIACKRSMTELPAEDLSIDTAYIDVEEDVSIDLKPFNPLDLFSYKLPYIAHAGGMIEGHCYTNSLEAVQHSIDCGIRFIELDLCLSTDSQVVAAHDWTCFNDLTGYVGDSAAVSIIEFRKRKIYGHLTPLTWVEIDTLMENNPDLFLVTDKISSPAILNSFLWNYRHRVLVECFSESDYNELEKDGYFCMLSRRSSVFEPSRDFTDLFENYVFWHELVTGKNNNQYKNLCGKAFFVFTMPDRHSADSVLSLDDRIKLVYIDNVEP